MKKLLLLFILPIFFTACVNSSPDSQKIKELEKELHYADIRSDWKTVVALSSELIKYAPNHTNANFTRGTALMHLRKHKEAIDSLNVAIKYHHQAKYPFQSEYTPRLHSIYKRMVLNYSYYIRGQCFEALGKLEEALESYDLAIKYGYDERYIYFSRNQVLIKLGRDPD